MKDYLTNGHVPPAEDEKQNWIVTNIAESDGVTTMEFYRKKDTGDVAGDNIIGVGTSCKWTDHLGITCLDPQIST